MRTVPPGPSGAGAQPRIAARRRVSASDNCRPVSRASRVKSSEVRVSAAIEQDAGGGMAQQHHLAAPQVGDGAIDLPQPALDGGIGGELVQHRLNIGYRRRRATMPSTSMPKE